jgi:two-component system, sensor histidine kinase and response regulator
MNKMTQTSDRVFDRARALDNLENNEDLLREIAGIYLADYRGELDGMRTAIARGDADTLFRLAHTLKGTMSTFCAQRGFETTVALVRLAREGKLDGIAAPFGAVEAVAEELAAALRAELG